MKKFFLVWLLSISFVPFIASNPFPEDIQQDSKPESGPSEPITHDDWIVIYPD